ncbi:hypothetical protein A3Q56_04294 [Intoshia linei]|uniref:Solute carrier family 25 member 38 homolog n=1 Tax=Intoshia linei TaxID=1819745 RepID=A0A177B100_9BILA|nr:hypothetical protein A3Q56_04294 [Intoshia linei]
MSNKAFKNYWRVVHESCKDLFEQRFGYRLFMEKNVSKSFYIGMLNGLCVTVLLQPFDFIKTNIQISKMNSLVQQFSSPTKFIQYWSGLTPSILRNIPGIAIYFSSFTALTNIRLKMNNTKMNSFEFFGLSFISRSFAGMCLLPFTILKVRYESRKYQYKTILYGLRSIYYYEGLRGLFAGMIPTILRDSPYSAIYVALYYKFKQMYDVGPTLLLVHIIIQVNLDKNVNVYINISCGLLAGTIASTLTHPADVIKTNMQYKSSKDVTIRRQIQNIYLRQGINGLFYGLPIRCVKKSLTSTISWCIYDYLS